MKGYLNIDVEFKLQDFWVGAYWKRGIHKFDIWICIIPCFPIHIESID